MSFNKGLCPVGAISRPDKQYLDILIYILDDINNSNNVDLLVRCSCGCDKRLGFVLSNRRPDVRAMVWSCMRAFGRLTGRTGEG